ncbi:hypothetical protein F4802DRAFT_596427 [Xylaria palmicola]|nr:hypothetical protein F4802DRAFT_596427 [Xylaria palmicola]
MRFFCVYVKHRDSREKHSRREAKKHGSQSPDAQVEEARPKGSSPGKKGGKNKKSKKKKRPGEQTRRRHMSRDMAHRCAEHAADHHHQCPCAYCHSRLNRPRTRNSEHGPDDHGGCDAQGRARHGLQHATQLTQVYVHPHSTRHYRLPVVDHSAACHGHGHSHGRGRSAASYEPVCYTALAPEAASVRDVEAMLARRPGLAVMARLSTTEALVQVAAFHSVRALYEATFQVEVWECDDCVGDPRDAV